MLIKCFFFSFFSDNADDPIFVFTMDTADYYSIQSSIIKKGYTVLDSSIQFLPKPNFKVSLSEADLEMANKIYQKLKAEEDVVRIYDNIE